MIVVTLITISASISISLCDLAITTIVLLDQKSEQALIRSLIRFKIRHLPKGNDLEIKQSSNASLHCANCTISTISTIKKSINKQKISAFERLTFGIVLRCSLHSLIDSFEIFHAVNRYNRPALLQASSDITLHSYKR